MSEENDTNNPYQPPSLSDEPLVKQEVARPNAMLTPGPRGAPGFGLRVRPSDTCFQTLADYARSQERHRNSATSHNIVETLFECNFLVRPTHRLLVPS